MRNFSFSANHTRTKILQRIFEPGMVLCVTSADNTVHSRKQSSRQNMEGGVMSAVVSISGVRGEMNSCALFA